MPGLRSANKAHGAEGGPSARENNEENDDIGASAAWAVAAVGLLRPRCDCGLRGQRPRCNPACGQCGGGSRITLGNHLAFAFLFWSGLGGVVRLDRIGGDFFASDCAVQERQK